MTIDRLPSRLLVLSVGWLAACAAALVPVAANATVLRRLSIEEMTRQSPVVVRGRVRGQRFAWNGDRSRILTFTDLEVTDYVRGAGSRVLRIRQIGGEMDGLRQDVPGNARLVQGEEVLLFLNTDASGDYFVTGMAQGKFRIRIDPATRQPLAERDLEGAALAEVDPNGRMLVREGTTEGARRLADLIAEVRAVPEVAR